MLERCVFSFCISQCSSPLTLSIFFSSITARGDSLSFNMPMFAEMFCRVLYTFDKVSSNIFCLKRVMRIIQVTIVVRIVQTLSELKTKIHKIIAKIICMYMYMYNDSTCTCNYYNHNTLSLSQADKNLQKYMYNVHIIYTYMYTYMYMYVLHVHSVNLYCSYFVFTVIPEAANSFIRPSYSLIIA